MHNSKVFYCNYIISSHEQTLEGMYDGQQDTRKAHMHTRSLEHVSLLYVDTVFKLKVYAYRSERTPWGSAFVMCFPRNLAMHAFLGRFMFISESSLNGSFYTPFDFYERYLSTKYAYHHRIRRGKHTPLTAEGSYVMSRKRPDYDRKPIRATHQNRAERRQQVWRERK